MKNIFLIKKKGILAMVCLLSAVFAFTSCKDDDDAEKSPVTVNSVHLQDTKYPDKLITFARLGNLVRLDGSGFTGITEVQVNGTSAYVNPTYMTNTSIIFRIPKDAPTSEAPENVRNTIKFIKGASEFVYEFDIRAAAPLVSGISHTLPQAGETITIYGSDLVEIDKITFPGDVIVTDGIVSDEDGKFCTVVVPSGITQSGALLVEGSNGGAYSPAYFNFREGITNNFDDVDTYSWGGGEISGNLTASIPSSGNGPKSQGNYRSLNKDGITFAVESNKQAWGWCNSAKWTSILDGVIPFSSLAKDVAFQFDIYVANDWNSGSLHIVMLDEFRPETLYEYDYTPWIDNFKRGTFTSDSWFTVTIPLNKLEALSEDGQVFQSLMDKEATTNYHQYGVQFNNSKIDDIDAIATNVMIYYDNFRFVPLETPEYDEFGDQ